MKLRFATVLLVLFMLPALTFSQDRKAVKKKQVESRTTYEYFIEEGIKDPVIENYQVFDTVGNVIEFKDLNREGGIKSWMKYKYDSERNVIEEITLNDKGKIENRIVWLYKDNLVVEKKYYDFRDRLYKRKEYKYEYRDN